MPVKDFSLFTFEDLMLLRGDHVEPGTFPWLLWLRPALLFPAWLFKGWKGETKEGRDAWPAPRLTALLLLRHSENGMTRAGSVRKARTDAGWRTALQLPWREAPPHEKTLREFEAFLKEPHPDVGRPRIEVAFEHWTRLGIDSGLLGDAPVWVADSTPMWCFGAVLGTVRLLGDGLRSLAKRWARARGVDLKAVALEWGEPLLLAKSTKGYFEGTDWADANARSTVLSTLVASVCNSTERVFAGLSEVRQNKRKGLARCCRNLLRVVDEDLEPTEEGGLQVKKRRSSKRLISYTDPEAQHFRKSKSKVCSGYKLHAFGDAVSGLILSLSVTPGGDHDSTQLVPLLVRAKALYDDIREVLADSAYGGMQVRQDVAETTGAKVIAPPVGNTRKGKGLGKEDFEIDFASMVARCPGGVVTATWKTTKRNGEEVPTFIWDKGSEESCQCRDDCLVHRPRTLKSGNQGAPTRRLQLHPQEEELRAVRAEWQESDTRARYRRRSEGERLMREATRRGARHAGAWGLDNASLQAHAAVAVSNLLVLAKHLAAQECHQRKRAI